MNKINKKAEFETPVLDDYITAPAIAPGATGLSPWASGPEELAAHEFHYAALENLPEGMRYAYEVTRGHGIDGDNDGLVLGNLLASFSHRRHAAQNP